MLKRHPWPVILQVVPELSTGGAERTCIEVAEAVTLAGGHALVLSEGGRLHRELVDVGGELIPFPARTKNPFAIHRNAGKMARIIKALGVTLVHARSRAPAWSALLAARRTKRPFVTTYHGIYNQKGKIKSFYNGVMARGDAVICNSQFTADMVRARHPDAKDRITVIYRGVDVERFNRGVVPDERVAALRSAWGVVPAEARIVIHPARLARWKGQQVLIEAVAKLIASGGCKNTVFVLVGDEQTRSAYRAELAGMISAHNLEGKVILAGHCDDMAAAFKAATLTVIPSIEAEAFGRVSIEAQAMGCPVLAANIGALPETLDPKPADPSAQETIAPVFINGAAITSQDTSWLFEPGNPGALADALAVALARNSADLEAYGAQSMERARRHFSKQALQIQTLGVYDRLLGTQLAEMFQAAKR